MRAHKRLLHRVQRHSAATPPTDKNFPKHRKLVQYGRCVLIRPARRSDAEQVQAFVRGLSATSRRERFFLAYRELPPSLLERIVGRSSAGANVVRAYVALTAAQLCC